MHFGHTECTRFVPLLTLQKPGEEPRLFQLIRDEPEDVTVMRELFELGLGGMAFRDDRPLEMAARGLGVFRAAPGWLLGRVRRWADARLRSEAGTSAVRLLADALRGKVKVGGLTLTSHHFMSPEELGTPVGQDRLAACVFRLPYKGEMVPMCQMNADGVREKFYAEIIDGHENAGNESAGDRRLLPVVH
jgi:hypothetical protein